MAEISVFGVIQSSSFSITLWHFLHAVTDHFLLTKMFSQLSRSNGVSLSRVKNMLKIFRALDKILKEKCLKHRWQLNFENSLYKEPHVSSQIEQKRNCKIHLSPPSFSALSQKKILEKLTCTIEMKIKMNTIFCKMVLCGCTFLVKK